MSDLKGVLAVDTEKKPYESISDMVNVKITRSMPGNGALYKIDMVVMHHPRPCWNPSEGFPHRTAMHIVEKGTPIVILSQYHESIKNRLTDLLSSRNGTQSNGIIYGVENYDELFELIRGFA